MGDLSDNFDLFGDVPEQANHTEAMPDMVAAQPEPFAALVLLEQPKCDNVPDASDEDAYIRYLASLKPV